ncbi:hypothetical protein [Nocardiopsis sp. NRRL B-16309]|uniref:hypothetical protein n=1 Tax=Nocardiopsis sp. NRRL B-16309 TaxID=1519494 RepID=UPI0006AD9988|nr:hypothetical protein [Nocardiopsis sp. NRRL B-16309]KOX10142.1 hypothetical protein ADL05_26050 [Nocardiopsis sp. NRRL B-16309]
MGDLPLIEVERYGDSLRILVDGKPLPCPVDESGVRIVAAPGYPSAINVTIPAREVRLVDTSAPKVPEEDKQKVADYLNSKAPPSSWRPKPRT